MSLSEAALRKLTKDEVIILTLEYQSKFDNTIFNINKELSQLRSDFKKIESELSVSKNVNSKLHELVVALERQCWGNNQYSRCECLEIFVVPDSVVLVMMIWRKLPSKFLISWTCQLTLQTLSIVTG